MRMLRKHTKRHGDCLCELQVANSKYNRKSYDKKGLDGVETGV